MALDPPRPQFITVNDDGSEGNVAVLYDAGVVDADEMSGVTRFNLWNNRGGATAIADMINVDITVRDADGAQLDGRIVNWTAGVMYVQFLNYAKSTAQQWGYNTGTGSSPGTWQYDDGSATGNDPRNGILKGWASLKGSKNVPVIACINDTSGTTGGYRQIKGTNNDGNYQTTANRANISMMKFKVYAQPTAPAGQVDWITRISYQYN